MSLELREIKKPDVNPTYSDIVANGPNISPQKRLQLFDDGEWEVFIEEYADGLKAQYVSILRTGGAGDRGVDVAAFKTTDGFNKSWDNYQCKHYNHPLRPSDVILEMGKLCYYTFLKEYPIPDNYYFVCPHGVGTSLGKYLRGKHVDFRNLIIREWTKKCEKDITSVIDVPLEGDLKKYVEEFDFSIVKDITVLKLLEVHRTTPYHHAKFGGGLPSRPKPETPPEIISEIEAVYIKRLLEAYAEYLEITPCHIGDLERDVKLKEHLQRARIQFYSAESLYKFSRDYLNSGEFERLQDYIYDGIENIVSAEHKNGFERVKSVVQEAYKLQIDSHPLKDRIVTPDRAGICHQLANNNRLKWANNDPTE